MAKLNLDLCKIKMKVNFDLSGRDILLICYLNIDEYAAHSDIYIF